MEYTILYGGFLIMLTAIILYLVLGNGERIEPIELPRNTNGYWEDVVPFFEDGLTEEYGSRAKKFAPWILEASEHYGVPPVVLARLIFKESSFRESVVSRSGAVGPAQIKPRFWARFCANDIYEAEGNVKCSAQILAFLEDECGNLRCALAHYNAGYGRPSRGYVEYILNGNS